MRIGLIVAALWFGICEGLIEPGLPGHYFGLWDALELVVGAIAGLAALWLEHQALRAGETGSESGEAAWPPRLFMAAGFGLTWFFAMPLFLDPMGMAEPYLDIVYRFSNGVSAKDGNKLVEMAAVVAFLMPFAVSTLKASFCAALWGLAQHQAGASRYASFRGNFQEAAPWVFLLHPVVGLLYLTLDLFS